MQKELYKIANKTDSKKIAEFLSRDGQLLLPFLEMISNTEQAIDELIDVVGKAAIEAVLMLSAQQIAGGKQPGKARNGVSYHGSQYGVVSLSERKLRVEKPRLRKKGKGSGNPADQVGRVRLPREGEVLGVVEAMPGGSRLQVSCEDGKERLIRIPGKIRRKIWVRIGDIVIVKPWEIEPDSKADLVWRYTKIQSDWLRRKGILKD